MMKQVNHSDSSAIDQLGDSYQLGPPNFISALVIDDSAFDRKRLRRELERTKLGFDLHEVATLTELRDAIVLKKYDVIFVDYQLNDGSGLDAMDIIRSTPLNIQTGAIMVSGNRNTAVVVEALKRGCCDYMTKETMDPASLTRAMINAVEKAKLAERLLQAHKLQSELDKVLDGFSKDCISQMKPMLSRMLQDVNQGPPIPPTQDASHHKPNDLEFYGLKLWTFIEEIETYAAKIQHLSDARKARSATP